MLNIAVIGAGKLGEFHIKLLKTSTKFNLVGFHEKNKERLNEISSKYARIQLLRHAFSDQVKMALVYFYVVSFHFNH